MAELMVLVQGQQDQVQQPGVFQIYPSGGSDKHERLNNEEEKVISTYHLTSHHPLTLVSSDSALIMLPVASLLVYESKEYDDEEEGILEESPCEQQEAVLAPLTNQVVNDELHPPPSTLVSSDSAPIILPVASPVYESKEDEEGILE